MAAKYGNSGGRNKGKKYVKLRGDEIATPEAEARASEFMKWYGDNFDALRSKLLYDEFYDDEVATDTALYLYDCIAYKGLKIDNYKWYYLRAYHTALLGAKKKNGEARAAFVSVDEPVIGEVMYGDILPAPTFDYTTYEMEIDAVQREILEYVRASYDQVSVSLFEIYVTLQPEMSYKKLARMLGIPANKIWPVIGAIRKDVAVRFADRRDYLLSLL